MLLYFREPLYGIDGESLLSEKKNYLAELLLDSTENEL